METEPAEPNASTPPEAAPEEPVAAVTTNETTPVWAHGESSAPPEDEATPAMPMAKGEPDWSEAESSANGDGAKTTPPWAQTVPTAPGEPIDESEPVEPKVRSAQPPADDASTTEPPAEVTAAPITDPPKAVAADSLKSTWPPRAETAPAPPEETDIWPPEPPTEHAMPAWPPSSGLAAHAAGVAAEEEPATPAQAIPSWSDTFESISSEPAASPGVAEPAKPAPEPPLPVAPVTPAPAKAGPPAAAAPAPATVKPTPPAPAAITSPAPPAPPPPAPPRETAPPVEPAQAGPPARPAWAPRLESTEPPPAPAPRPEVEFQVPAWAPRVPLAAEPGTPTWFSPKEQIPHSTSQPMAQPASHPAPAPAPPVVGGQLPVAQVPASAPAQPAKPAPPAGAAQPASAKPTWQVVEQRPVAKAPQGPTAEDRSYAEWFAWAKRGGAPASACHAAAQGAFKALSSGKDVNTAVQWATASMSRPPENVSYARQQYCAWFSLANIDLNLDQHRAHAFAGAAVHALDAGADASAAHAAGLAAAGIR